MVRILSLVENTSASPAYRSKHGLCLYVETERHKILFDLGSNDLFAENAGKLNIDISKIVDREKCNAHHYSHHAVGAEIHLFLVEHCRHTNSNKQSN